MSAARYNFWLTSWLFAVTMLTACTNESGENSIKDLKFSKQSSVSSEIGSNSSFATFSSNDFEFSVEYPKFAFNSSKERFAVLPHVSSNEVTFDFLPERKVFVWKIKVRHAETENEILSIFQKEIDKSCGTNIGNFSVESNGIAVKSRYLGKKDPSEEYCWPVTGWWNTKKGLLAYWKNPDETIYEGENHEAWDERMFKSFRWVK